MRAVWAEMSKMNPGMDGGPEFPSGQANLPIDPGLRCANGHG